MLKTNRCKINNIKKEDYEDIKKLYFNKEVREFLGGIVDKQAYDHIFSQIITYDKNSFYWVVRYHVNDEFIGLVSLDRHHDGINTEVSYQFMPKWWGDGYGEEIIKRIINYAFEELKLTRIVAETQSANKASCKLLKKIGMKLEQSVERFGAEQYIFSISN